MANPTLHWRMLTPIYVASPTSAAWMEALYTAGTSTSYADGTVRTPGTFAAPGTPSLPATLGTGSAWTWNYDATTFGTGAKTAIYGYPPTTTALNQVAIACSTSSVAGAVWKQLQGDSRTAGYIYMGLAKNSGTYTSWNTATTPFTVGDFTGLGSIGGTNANYLLMWECEEAVIVQVVNTASGVSVGAVGAFIDPLSANTANAETDGRLYGISVTGYSAVMNAGWLSVSGSSQACLFTNQGAPGDQHFYTFTPGAGTLTGATRFGTYAPTYSFVSRNGDLPQIPFQVWTGTQYLGQLRQIFITRDSATGLAWTVGGTPKGYLLSSQVASSNDAVLLAY